MRRGSLLGKKRGNFSSSLCCQKLVWNSKHVTSPMFGDLKKSLLANFKLDYQK